MSLDAIIAWVIGLVESIVQFVIDVVNFLIGVLNVIFGFIWNVLVAVAQFLLAAFRAIGQFFVNLWQNYIKPAIQGILHIYQVIRAKLQAIFGPIIKRLQWLRAIYYQYVYKWVLLVQNILSFIRVMLSALRILGVKWAAKLDADIQKIQSFITTWTSTFVSALNQATTWLNFAIDPFGLVRKSVFSPTLFTQLPQLSRAVTFGQNRALSASEQQETVDDSRMAAGGAAILTRNADGSVTYSDASKRINDAADQAWQYYGGTTAVH